MGKQAEIRDLYWVEFLKWYASESYSKVETLYCTSSDWTIIPVEDVFWHWLVSVKAEYDSNTFFEKLEQQ